MTATAPEMDLSAFPHVTAFFDQDTNTISYVVRDPKSTACADTSPKYARLSVERNPRAGGSTS